MDALKKKLHQGWIAWLLEDETEKLSFIIKKSIF